jgi:hypothetical protein
VRIPPTRYNLKMKRAPTKIILAFAFILSLSTVVLLELGLRMLPFFVGEPMKSLIQEAALSPRSTLRMHGPLRSGTAIVLPPAQTADLISVGDSITFGTLVNPEDTFTALVGKQEHLRVVNLGVTGTNPEQYNRMVEVGMRYHPSTVLYNVFANDFVYSKPTNPTPLTESHTFAHLPGDEALFVDQLTIQEKTRDLVRRIYYSSSILKWANWMFFIERGPHGVSWQDGNLHYEFAGRAYWTNQISWDRRWVKEGLDLNVHYIDLASQFLKERGIRLVVLLMPSKEMVYGPLVSKGTLIFSESHEKTYLELASRLQKEHIDVYSLTPYLREKAKEGLPLYHVVDGHFSEIGHQEVAKFIERVLGPQETKFAHRK